MPFADTAYKYGKFQSIWPHLSDQWSCKFGPIGLSISNRKRPSIATINQWSSFLWYLLCLYVTSPFSPGSSCIREWIYSIPIVQCGYNCTCFSARNRRFHFIHFTKDTKMQWMTDNSHNQIRLFCSNTLWMCVCLCVQLTIKYIYNKLNSLKKTTLAKTATTAGREVKLKARDGKCLLCWHACRDRFKYS